MGLRISVSAHAYRIHRTALFSVLGLCSMGFCWIT